MRKTVKLTEQHIKKIVSEALRRLVLEDDEGCRSIQPSTQRFTLSRNSQEYALNVYMKEIDNFKGYYDCWEIYYLPLDELHNLIHLNAMGHGIVDDDLVERVWEHVKEKREELHKIYPDNLPRPKEKKKKKHYSYGNGGPFTPEFDNDMGWH